jgi:hypothetical protein
MNCGNIAALPENRGFFGDIIMGREFKRRKEKEKEENWHVRDRVLLFHQGMSHFLGYTHPLRDVLWVILSPNIFKSIPESIIDYSGIFFM